jgi:hypothetical protein
LTHETSPAEGRVTRSNCIPYLWVYQRPAASAPVTLRTIIPSICASPPSASPTKRGPRPQSISRRKSGSLLAPHRSSSLRVASRSSSSHAAVTADSGPCRPLIPEHAGPPLRISRMPAADFAPSRAGVSRHAGPLWVSGARRCGLSQVFLSWVNDSSARDVVSRWARTCACASIHP